MNSLPFKQRHDDVKYNAEKRLPPFIAYYLGGLTSDEAIYAQYRTNYNDWESDGRLFTWLKGGETGWRADLVVRTKPRRRTSREEDEIATVRRAMFPWTDLQISTSLSHSCCRKGLRGTGGSLSLNDGRGSVRGDYLSEDSPSRLSIIMPCHCRCQKSLSTHSLVSSSRDSRGLPGY